ncbi:MAG: hypothetical protein KJ060_21395 [Candidatus Hydrogenedentes bacterium]|nr:hypothetical protein [Candidatus Hydrogenedentota bacterium]
MNGTSCCQSPVRRSGLRSRVLETTGWAVPGALLVLMPKCPACVAGYIALATGVGISFTAAAYLRTGLLVASVGLLILLAARQVHGFVRRRRAAR